MVLSALARASRTKVGPASRRGLAALAAGAVRPPRPSTSGARAGVRAQPIWQGIRSFSVITQSVLDFGAESIKEGTLMEFKKHAGEAVTKGEIVASIETDKVTVDVMAEESGVIKELLAKPDDNVVVGQALFKIEVGAAASAAAPAPAAAAPAAGGAPGRMIEQAVNDFGGESITEGTLMEWRKGVGESVGKGEILAIIETDKVSVELLAEESGVVREILVQADETVEVGKVVVKIEAGAAGAAAPAAASSSAAAPSAAAAAPVSTAGLSGFRLGLARAAAARAGLPDPAATPAAPAAAASSAAAPVMPAAVAVGEGRTERRVPMSWVRRRVAQRLKESQNTLALITTFQEADVSESVALKSKHKDLFQKTHGADLGLMSFFIKASATGLMDIPGVNAVIDDAKSEVVYRDYVDIAVPIQSPRGPVSCTLRNVESMSIKDIEQKLADLSDKARNDQLGVEDMSSASFGIADSGPSGGWFGTTFINPPASATLGCNAVKDRAAVVNGKVVARPMMYLSLTYDHRLVDGREAATFLGSVRDKLEDPSRMLLDL